MPRVVNVSGVSIVGLVTRVSIVLGMIMCVGRACNCAFRQDTTAVIVRFFRHIGHSWIGHSGRLHRLHLVVVMSMAVLMLMVMLMIVMTRTGGFVGH
jgi:hypothetical protein